MLLPYLKLTFRILNVITTFFITAAHHRLTSIYHRLTYHALPPEKCRNILILGGSFAGLQAARLLAHSVPTGHRVILIEKNSHFHWTFAFPRYSVVRGHESTAFIPFSGIADGAPTGVFTHVQDKATCVRDDVVELASGAVIPYEYLAIATGTAMGPPARVFATEKKEGCEELKRMQRVIEKAERIAVVGGGAVGVQLACDIKSYHPGKRVVLVHSREKLLNRFGDRLHAYAIKALQELGVEVVLSERPEIPKANVEGGGSIITPTTMTLHFKSNGKTETFDLILPCTGSPPLSSPLAHLSPTSISPTTSSILVHPTLQLLDPQYPNIFALGDVAETGGAKSAIAGMTQAEVVAANIRTLISRERSGEEMKARMRMARGGGSVGLRRYQPGFFEGILKLTLGKNHTVLYIQTQDGKESGSEFLKSVKGGRWHRDDGGMDLGRAWRELGVKVGDFSA
ncbi:MAG: hypothetical protein M1834_003962 [Cirrosporium novae-zelandiae]|nr:MAG: hypothetical protein M1834_003962 [Cirrosporium novae-zelandiae]